MKAARRARRPWWAILLAGVGALVFPGGPAARAAERERDAAEAWLPVLDAAHGGDLVVFQAARAGVPQLLLLARVRAPAARLAALLSDPQAYRRAVPAFVRADVLETRAAGPAEGRGPPSLRLAWELEIPLWNLEGRLWLRPQPDGAVLEIDSGDMAPGRFQLRAVPDPAAPDRAVLVVAGGASVKNGNWITRRLAARDAMAEPAMSATAVYVLARGLALEAERRGSEAAPARWPRAAMSTPGLGAFDGRALARLLAERAPAPAQAPVVALVHSRADGRLARVEVAVRPTLPAAVVSARLHEPALWQALPGWKTVRPTAGNAPAGFVLWDVACDLPFVDFDARWAFARRPPLRAVVREGDWHGPALGWDVVALPLPSPGAATTSIAVLSLHPRLENTGYLPRRLIEAEPLLEHGLALGLGYVDALSLARALAR